jgi:serine-type D-Ala-D-Ala carboxypeptidase (penicillin-binding protein 5/6)
VVGAALHQPTGRAQLGIGSAFRAATALLASTRRVLVTRRVIKRGATLAWLQARWADPVELRAAESVSLLGWPGLRIRTSIATADNPHTPLNANQNTATALLSAGQQQVTIQLLASRAVPDAILTWRLTHP